MEDEVVSKWGITKVFDERMEVYSSTYLLNVNNTLDICILTAHDLREKWAEAESCTVGEILEEKAKAGLVIRILTIDPESEHLAQRESSMGKKKGEMKEQVESLIKWANGLQESKNSKVSIKCYDAPPLDFYLKVDEYLFFGPYRYKQESANTKTIMIKKRVDGKNTKGFEYHTKYFEKLWVEKDFKDCAKKKEASD